MKNRGAIELSMTTIVVVVLAMSMLILGMVLVRNIMCGAMGLTTDINTKVTSQINKMFTETSEIDVHCVGEGGDLPVMPVGKTSFIMCTIRSTGGGSYQFTVTQATHTADGSGDVTDANSWITSLGLGSQGQSTVGSFDIGPSQERTFKILKIVIPTVAPGDLSILLNYELLGSNQNMGNTIGLDFKVGRVSGLQNTMC
jgi:hypothetical protein